MLTSSFRRICALAACERGAVLWRRARAAPAAGARQPAVSAADRAARLRHVPAEDQGHASSRTASSARGACCRCPTATFS